MYRNNYMNLYLLINYLYSFIPHLKLLRDWKKRQQLASTEFVAHFK